MIELPVLQNSERDSDASSPRTRFWRSVEQLQGSEEYQAFTGSELMPEAAGSPGQTTRRGFLHIMGASMALAGLAGCRKPIEHIMPFSRRPEDTIPGVPMQYASGMEFRGALRPILVESTDGRPTKIEGNPEHPESSGSSGVFEQASLLGLYDPDRSKTVMRDGDGATFDDFVNFVASRPASSRVAVLAAPSSSMTLAAQRRAIQAAGGRWIEYDASGSDQAAAALQLAYGQSLRARYNFSRADVILSLDADFLGMQAPDALHNASGFAASRRMEERGSMSRLYVAEPSFSVTGGMADHHKAVKASQVAGVGAAIARALGIAVEGGREFDNDPWVQAAAADLQAAGSAGVVVAGEGQSRDAHLIAVAINAMLGAVGTTVSLMNVPNTGSATRFENLAQLVLDMASGRVDMLVTMDCNPVYDAPASLRFAEAMERVPETVHLGLYQDETAHASRWHLPMAHYLEAWSDGRSFGGALSVVQPLIAPLYDGARSPIEVSGLLADRQNRTGYDRVRATWQGFASGGTFEQDWRKVLHDGFAEGTAYGSFSDAPSGLAGALAGVGRAAPGDGLEVVFRTSSSVLDGSFANNAWLQELPDATTKIVWDNVAIMSPGTAERLGLGVNLSEGRHYADLATVTVGDSAVEIPIWIQHGTAEDTVVLEMGYGRSIATDRAVREPIFFDLDAETDIYGQGAVANGVGSNVAPLRSVASPGFASGASVAAAGSDYMIATTQDHGAMPDEGAEMMGRGLFRMATVEEYQADPYFVADGDPKPIGGYAWEDYPALWEYSHPSKQDAYKDNPYYANQWGMVIDLNTCTGCNACVVACQSENNIQVVGKDEVARGREMSWIRMDRYFVGGDGAGELQMVQQPVPCMHCENAPCESVCPVAATVHSPDGTNQMIYNRCIGTRYCANNCPYKVRRFNYYNWSKTLPESLHMAQNPNVTVRSRGVMEKCSYCIQRIREVNRQVNVEGREIRDGDVVTACQQACPSHAISFGDLNDPTSKVVQDRANPRRYELLAELSVKPRTSYLGRLRNPNTTLASAASAPAESE
ncbi:MAG: TAT-variant-translocated molybdopterin oxidoreductase [Rhodothermales bacterium]|nr:TAT-variant-translocated molybdopterin oxidoreductase [Rhodothermales bacterium]MBO6779161.1 TAT-variant-translocated molybdopterin oxidoreductase [Rhodothermales bacterium]